MTDTDPEDEKMNASKDTAERVRATQERRRSGAAGTHADRRTRRLRTRSAQDRAARREFD